MELDLAPDAATALTITLAELMVELVKAGALRRAQAAKILLRAEGFIEALQFQRDPDETPAQHFARIGLHRFAVEGLSEHVQKRLALKPDVGVLRYRRRRLAEEYRRRRKKI